MKKISLLIMILVLSWCSWNYKNWDIQENIDAKTAQELQDELDQLEQQKIKETLAKIELENDIASEILDDFLKSDNFDIKEEIEKTKEKYNDSLGPILEYEHEVIQEEEEEEEEEEDNLESLTWSTLSWTILDTKSWSINNNNNNNIIENIQDNWNVYSWEVKIISDDSDSLINTDNEIIEEEIENQFVTESKTGKSWVYTMYIWVTDNCSGWLEMQDLEQNKKWLFENSCEQIIYDFELAVWGIDIYYNTADWWEKTQFVSIK